MENKVIMQVEYDGESIIDIDQHIYDAIEDADLPTDKYGFMKGTIVATLVWVNDDE